MTDEIYCEESFVDIHEEVFDKDLDDVAYEPTEVDDSDNEAAELYGYNR